uniref:F-box domain-containing protein n=3 Tax=Aegilops tauschii subsp. strangulata TaxID=200361 RepID=A0A453QME8_AEGTS|nr:MEIOTIC F-BOX protein MOF [Aegilops tauschii subsp. strangulata]XP_040250397.1 MEIOTIC F-BOX protein MOF [Aegilops tauschii subsp. strangulata]XP_040250398.1 MEIOTIC F-BOX protein MOF [Aegilops tauschii subsp. strangulata]XP_040250399.1 MEIOTIC F-BOX protein MOF [Aegilops tauschii subsp. strangulata]
MSPRKKPKAEAVSLDAAGLDRLSALPDDLLHAVMSFLRAWEVARTCVLSRRWRTLWASAPCVDLRVCCKARHRRLPTRLANFTNHFLLLREASAPLDALRLLSSPPRQDVPYMPYSPQYDDDGEDYSSEDVEMWIRAAINRRARFIQLSHHPRDDDLSDLDNVPLVSCHLKHLHLSGTMLYDKTLRQLSSHCPSLQVLELKDCSLDGPHISSASLITLTMVECRFIRDLTVAAPNLISLRCVNPYHRAPSFEDMASLATATIVLNDSFLHDEFEERYVEPDPEVFECDSDSNDDSDADSDLSTCDEFYGDKVLGGQNVIRSLSNATSLELIADAEEVILNRELEMCPVFSNLKVLSLGEWCMAADLHPLVLFLQHAPNLERLFLKLKTEHEEIDDDIKPEGTSFACKNLTMVNIKCPKDDERVPVLEQFFVANGIAMEKISVYHRPTHQPRLSLAIRR